MYTKIESCLWDDEKTAVLDDDCKLLWLYLLSTRHRNIVGLYSLPHVYATHQLKWSMKKYKKAFNKLLEIGFIKYDEETELVFIVNFLSHKFNAMQNGNQVTSAIEKVDELPTSKLFNDLVNALQKFYKPFYEPLIKHLSERFNKQFGKQVTVTVTVKETVTLEEGTVSSSTENNGEPKATEGTRPPTADEAYAEIIQKGGNTTKEPVWSHAFVGWAAMKFGGAAEMARKPEKDAGYCKEAYAAEYNRLCQLKGAG